MNSKTQILLQCWDFPGKSIDEALSLLKWIAWDSFEFEKAGCVYGYSFHDPCTFYAKSYYAPSWHDLCNSSAHNVSSCPYYACYTHSDSSLPLTQCTGLEVDESLGLGASFGMNNALYGLEDTFDMEHNLVDTPLEGGQDVLMHEGAPSLLLEITFSPIPLSIPMFLPVVHNLHFPLSILMMCPLIILKFGILLLIWAIRITYFICLMGMLKFLGP